MLKSITKAAFFIFLAGSVVESFAQFNIKDQTPYYMHPDFVTAKTAGYWKGGFPLIGKVKYVAAPPEVLKYKPAITRLLNQEGGFELVNISPGENMQSETWIAINPKNPNNIIATANDYKFIGGYQNYRMSSWRSMDGGKTWLHATTAANLNAYIGRASTGGMTIFDPGVAFNADGNALYSYGFTQTEAPQNKDENGVFVAATTNGGETWEGWGTEAETPKILPVALSKSESNLVFHDRYTIACDNNENSPYKNNYYIAWQRFKYKDGIAFRSSNDFGVTWSSEQNLGSGGTQAPVPAVGPDGEVYVAWIRSDYQNNKAAADVRVSFNGGKTFGNTSTAQSVYSIGDRNASSGRFVLTAKQSMRVSSPPQIAVDRSNKSTRGYAYVVQAGRETAGGKYGIYVSRTTDKGKTWKSNIRIDNSEIRNDMFFPSIAVDPITGMVVVFYYSSQNDPNNRGYDGYLAFSKDGGDTWKQIRLTPETHYIDSEGDVAYQGEAGNYYWGDYTGIDAYNGKIYPLFWMGDKNSPDPYNFGSLDLFTALISTNPLPPTNLVADNVDGGQAKVKLTWTHPATDMLGEALPDFKIYVYRDNQKIGEVDKSAAAEYTDASVADGQLYKYALKTVLPSGQESILIETTIAAGGARQPNPPTELSWRPASNGFILSWKNPTTAVDNSQLKDLEKINVYQNGVFVASVNKEQISGVAYTATTVPLPTEKFYKITLKAVGLRGGVETESISSEEIIVYSGPAFEAYEENFDNSNSQKQLYTNGNWAPTSAVKASGSSSFTDSPTGNYNNNASNWFMLPPVVISPLTKTLSFNQIALIHSSDYGLIEVSNDFGKTFKPVRGVDIRFSDKFVKGNAAASQWVMLDQDLSKDFMGDTVLVRIGLYSNSLSNDDGWYIDDIKFDGSVAGISEVSSPQLKASVSLYPNPAHEASTISLSINNSANVVMGVYDSMGRMLAELANGGIMPGSYTYSFNAANYADGVYYVRLTVDGETRATPFVIAK